MSLEGRVALVTGAGKGLGAVIARRLAQDGAKVVLLGRTAALIEAVAKEIDGTAIVCDVTDTAAVDAALAKAGDVSILVQNAGLAESAPLARTTDAMLDNHLALNVSAPLRLARALAPAMVLAKRGAIVHVASTAALEGFAYSAAYCASKHALLGLTRALAVELASTGVTVNAVCPGFLEDTDMTRAAIERIVRKTGRSAEQAAAELGAMNPQKRLIRPSEVADVVSMLCSDAGRGINGKALFVPMGATGRPPKTPGPPP